MKINALFLGALAQLASAHYIFDTTVRNGSPDPAWRYIRDTTRATKYNPIKFSSNPAVDIRDNSHADGPDIRCNQGAFNNAGRTEVLTVTAGSEVRVRLAYGAAIEHPGPTMFYMSRAPGDNVRAYDGSGDWFKIYQDGVCNQGDFTTTAWCSWGQTTIAARIPAGTPNGEYLLRAEHIGVHRSHVNQPEHYVSCVQVRVTGGGNGTPGPMVRFPGAYRVTDPYANFSVWNGHRSFPFPGPAVWNGAGGGSPPSTPPPTTNPPTSPPPSGGNCAPMWGQCGGEGWSGATCCSQGTCRASNQWYSQCV